MAIQLIAILVSLGLVGASAGVARSEVLEIGAGGTATFGWSRASGPVDHYEVQIATELEPPFSWSHYRFTDAEELSVSIPSAAFGAARPDVAHWAFDEGTGMTASDSTGNGQTGTRNGTLWVSDTPSGTGSALRFDGVDDSVQLGSLNVSGEALTIALWFKADDFGSSDGRLISKATGTAESDHHWMLSTIDSGGVKLRFRLKTNGVTTTLIASTGALSPGVWTHAAIVYDGATMRIYKNGVEVGVTSKQGALSTSSSVDVAIGNQPPGAGSRSFKGSIDDVRIYSEALAQPEVATLAAGIGSDASYVTVRTIAYDSIGNASEPSPISSTVHFLPVISWLYSVPDDFDGDSIPDVLTHDPASGVVMLELSSTGAPEQIDTRTEMRDGWEIVAQGDFDGDSREDIFWREKFTGDNRVWFEVGPNVFEVGFFGFPELTQVDPAWKILEAGDFDGDGRVDLFWQNEDTFETYVWFMNGPVVEVIDFPRLRSASWFLEASGDFDDSGTIDLLWHNLDDGRTAAWFIDGEMVEFASLPIVNIGSEVIEVSDLNQDGFTDLVWYRTDGSCEIWLMPDGEQFEGTTCPAGE